MAPKTQAQTPAKAATAPVAATKTPEQIIAEMTPAQRAEMAKALRVVVKDERQSLRGSVSEVVQDETDPNRLWLGVDLGSDPGTTGAGVAYLFRCDNDRFTHGGVEYRLTTYALAVKK